jgi:putative ABC transport system substrate-binding protein
MDRRVFLRSLAGGLLSAPLTTEAQPAGKAPFRLGLVSAGAPRTSPHWIKFDRRLRELGHVEGQTILTEFRNAEAQAERFRQIMQELVRLNVDVIVAPGPEVSLRAAKEATASIPIVTVAIDYDPIASGLVGGLARQGGNVTGVFLRQVELTGKRIEFLRETIPRATRLVVLWDALSADQVKQAEASAAGLQLQRVAFRDAPYDLAAAMRYAVQQRADGVLCLASPIFFRQREQLAETALRSRVPVVGPFREMAEAGILMSYGASLPEMFHRAAEYVDRILRGTRPSDMPMEQPTKFELVINIRTARALGLTIPQSLLVRADQVIE